MMPSKIIFLDFRFSTSKMDEMDSSGGKFRYFIYVSPICASISAYTFFLLIVASCSLSGNRYSALISFTNACRLLNTPVASTSGEVFR